ncbi:MAG TPA: heavy-metal-associated domain-containing protein [Chitinophagales bacterium]|nr:heavy-metal-associated domain-containing protein [Chitinophagales bacterium]
MELLFTTTLKCSGCEEKVKPYLDALDSIQEWKVDLSVHPKIVTVKGDQLDADEIIAAIGQAGFKAELV